MEIRKFMLRGIPGIIVLTAAVLWNGCSSGTPLDVERDLVVIMGYLYAGEPVDAVRVSSTVALDVDSMLSPPINDAVVALIRDSVRYELTPSSGDSGYYHYDGSDLAVNVGDEFAIEVQYYGNTASGETIVPTPPKGVTISDDTMTVVVYDFDDMVPGIFPGDLEDEEELVVTWNNDDLELHYVVVENIDTAAVEIETGDRFMPPGGGGGDHSPFRFISEPTRRDSFTVTTRSLTYTGLHRVKVYRVNQEYDDLYEGRQQDSRDLNEPLTNITDGLGVFTAFNSDSVFFYLEEED